MTTPHPTSEALYDAAAGRIGKGELLRTLVPYTGALMALDDDSTPMIRERIAMLYSSQEAATLAGWTAGLKPVSDWLALDVDGVYWDVGAPSELRMTDGELDVARHFARSLDAESALVFPNGAQGAQHLLAATYSVLIDASRDVPPTATWTSSEGTKLLIAFTAPDLADAWARDQEGGWEPVVYTGEALARMMLEADDLDGVCFNPEGPAGPVVLGPAGIGAWLHGADVRTEPRPARTLGEIDLWLTGQRPDVPRDAWARNLVTVDGTLVARYVAPDGRTYDFTPVDDAGYPESLGPILDPGWVLRAAIHASAADKRALYQIASTALGIRGTLPRTAFHDPREASLRRRFPDRFSTEAWI
ncbi:MAG: SseB family protein [Myxococcota bacterium]